MAIEIIQGGPYRFGNVPNRTLQNKVQGGGQGLNQVNTAINQIDDVQNFRANRNRPAVEQVIANSAQQAGETIRQSERVKLNAQVGSQESPMSAIIRTNNETNQVTSIQNSREEIKRIESKDMARVENQNAIRQQVQTTGAGGRTTANPGIQLGGRINITA